MRLVHFILRPLLDFNCEFFDLDLQLVDLEDVFLFNGYFLNFHDPDLLLILTHNSFEFSDLSFELMRGGVRTWSWLVFGGFFEVDYVLLGCFELIFELIFSGFVDLNLFSQLKHFTFVFAVIALRDLRGDLDVELGNLGFQSLYFLPVTEYRLLVTG